MITLYSLMEIILCISIIGTNYRIYTDINKKKNVYAAPEKNLKLL